MTENEKKIIKCLETMTHSYEQGEQSAFEGGAITALKKAIEVIELIVEWITGKSNLKIVKTSLIENV